MDKQSFIAFCCASVVIFRTLSVTAYRLGELVDTEIQINEIERSSPLLHQSPKFGLQWEKVIIFEKNNLLSKIDADDQQEARTVSFHYEDGLWSLPTLSLIKQNYGKQPQYLDGLTVQFVVTKSGAGAIHAVSMNDVAYISEHKPSFHVKYEWVEEKLVSSSNGNTIMFLMVLLTSIYFILVSCRILKSDGYAIQSDEFTDHDSDKRASVPKWD
jgi:hypothetical protein